MPTHMKVDEQLCKIEAELRRLGRWQEDPLPPSAFENMGAFGMNTMTPEQWLQFVLIPNVRSIIESEGTFPRRSEVAVYATRNLDGDAEAHSLLKLLAEFDALFR